jgi:hypothetical protein
MHLALRFGMLAVFVFFLAVLGQRLLLGRLEAEVEELQATLESME